MPRTLRARLSLPARAPASHSKTDVEGLCVCVFFFSSEKQASFIL